MTFNIYNTYIIHMARYCFANRHPVQSSGDKLYDLSRNDNICQQYCIVKQVTKCHFKYYIKITIMHEWWNNAFKLIGVYLFRSTTGLLALGSIPVFVPSCSPTCILVLVSTSSVSTFRSNTSARQVSIYAYIIINVNLRHFQRHTKPSSGRPACSPALYLIKSSLAVRGGQAEETAYGATVNRLWWCYMHYYVYTHLFLVWTDTMSFDNDKATQC